LDPLLNWVILDGYGFHEGFFSRKRYINHAAVPTHLSPYARRIFDQGLGRCIWFSLGAVVDLVDATIARFDKSRHADIWSGVGMASAYAGGGDIPTLEALLAAARPYKAQMARGVAIAAQGRKLAGHMPAHTDRVCQFFCGLSGYQAAQIADDARENLPTNSGEPIHEIWRQRIQAHFAESKTSV
jgi:hypothetical protein